jgi:hypothetical protein
MKLKKGSGAKTPFWLLTPFFLSGSAGVHGSRILNPGNKIHASIEDVGEMDIVMRQD